MLVLVSYNTFSATSSYLNITSIEFTNKIQLNGSY